MGRLQRSSNVEMSHAAGRHQSGCTGLVFLGGAAACFSAWTSEVVLDQRKVLISVVADTKLNEGSGPQRGPLARSYSNANSVRSLQRGG